MLTPIFMPVLPGNILGVARRQEEAEQMMYEGLRLISEGYTSKDSSAKYRWWDSLVKLFFKQGDYMKVCTAP